MERKLSAFEGLPSEIQAMIYQYLFNGIHIRVWRTQRRNGAGYDLSVTRRYHGQRETSENSGRAIMYASRRIHKEASEVFGACIKVDLYTEYLDSRNMVHNWQRRYYPLIRHLSILSIGRHAPNLSAFDNLQVLNLRSFEHEELFRLKLSPPNSAEISDKCFSGALDEKMKADRKQRLLQQGQPNWVASFLDQPVKPCRITARVLGSFTFAGRLLDFSLRKLIITFDLDTMETIKRELYYPGVSPRDPGARYYKVTENGTSKCWVYLGTKHEPTHWSQEDKDWVLIGTYKSNDQPKGTLSEAQLQQIQWDVGRDNQVMMTRNVLERD
jgi:hypothetical protein